MPSTAARVVVLDSEALSALAWPAAQAKSARRAQAVLEALDRLGGRASVPAPIIAEVSRSGARRAAVGHVLRHLTVVATDRLIAETAGDLLGGNQLDSRHAADAFVAATAIRAGYSLVLTGDPADLGRLTADHPGVAVQPLP